MQNNVILVVDDEPINLTAISSILTPEYLVKVANSGERALEVVTREPIPSLILLDLMMPGLNGFEVLTKLKLNPETHDIPVIIVTAQIDENDEEYGLNQGAVDYVTKPINPAILKARVRNHIVLKMAQDFLHSQNKFLETEIERRMHENIVSQDVAIQALAHLAEARDPETGNHIQRTKTYVGTLAENLRSHPRFESFIDDHFIALLRRSAALHDIGKVGIPDSILLKPGKLTYEEMDVMKTHAYIGAQAIERAEQDVHEQVDFLKLAKEIALWHHEKWDGSGYPDGLVGDEIPISARLMAIADVFDALISKRVYKEPISYDETREVIRQGKGIHFDPDITDVFIKNYDVYVSIAEQFKE